MNGARLYVEQDMETSEQGTVGPCELAIFSRRAPDKQSVNEDSAAVIPFDEDAGVVVVADGAGGQRGGAQASSLAVENLRDAMVAAKAEGGELREGILNGIEQANSEVCALATGAATTLAAVEIQGASVRPYHVGDSMILVVGQRGKIKHQTISHSPVGYGVEAGLIGEAEAMHHEERHLVSNMVGTTEMRIDIGPVIELARRDTLVLASDGLFDNLHIEEIVEMMRCGSLRRVAARLSEACRERMLHPEPSHPSKPDDLTFIALRRHS